jgi:antitoxin component YwqK of YwqJK toxin-antitoxin module
MMVNPHISCSIRRCPCVSPAVTRFRPHLTFFLLACSLIRADDDRRNHLGQLHPQRHPHIDRMKNIGILILAGLALLPAACRQSDPEDPSPTAEPLVNLEKLDLENPDHLKKLAPTAPLISSLDNRGYEGAALLYEPNERRPFTGWAKSLHPSGGLKMMVQVNIGLFEGRSVAWRDSGELDAIIHWKNGKGNGPTTTWHKNGTRKSEGTGKDDILDGLVTTWFDNGQKAKEVMSVNGTMEGPFTEWHENGKLKAQGTFKAGELEGHFVTWHKNGQKAVEANYKNGKLEGAGSRRSKSGQLIDDGFWIEGERMD